MDNNVSMSAQQLEIVQQWFGAVQDLNPGFLEQRDYELAARIYEALGMRVPDSIVLRIDGK